MRATNCVGLVAAVTLCAGLFATSAQVAEPAAAATSTQVSFGVVGDIGMSPQTDAVLDAVAASNLDSFFALGDLSYQDPSVTPESAWCSYVKSHVGQTYPFELVSGNHEDNGPDGYIDNFAACLPDRLGVTGAYARQFALDYPPSSPLVRFVMISPGNTYPPSTTPLTYKRGTPEYDWTAAEIDGARAAGIPFVVVGMHYYCLNISGHTCPIKPDIMNLLVSKKVDLYLQAHDHAYTRTHQLALSGGCPEIDTTTYNPACVADNNAQSVYAAGAGTVIATVGMGGQNINKEYPDDPTGPYFPSYMGSNYNKTFGFLRFDVTSTSLSAQFVRGAGGTFSDAFTITRGPDSTPPDTTITAAPSDPSSSTSASISFSSNEAGSTFACSLDGATPTSCTSPASYSGLSVGTHTFTVGAIDAAGNSDPTPATASWTVVTEPVPLFADDFESGRLDKWSVTTGGDGSATVQSSVVKTGTWAAALSETANAGSSAHLRHDLGANQTNTVIAIDERVETEGASGANVPLLRLFDAGGTRLLSLYRQNAASNKVYVSYAGTAYLTSVQIPLQTWVHVTVRYVVNGSAAGTLEVSVNGTVAYSTNNASLASFRTIQIGNDTAKQAGVLFADNVTVTNP